MSALSHHGSELATPWRVVAGADGEAPARSCADVRALVEQRLASERSRHLRYLVARLRSREDAEDVLQDFALKALQGAAGVREDKIDAWLSVSLRNALFDRYRRDGARRRLAESAAAEPVDCSEPEEVDESSIRCLSQSIAQLKPSYATVLRRADLEESTLKAVAEECGMTTNNAAVRLHRAREALRVLMHSRCSACPAPCLLASRFLNRSVA
jgi:RNA polymerase sigma-70 factor (ECF subfamily)